MNPTFLSAMKRTELEVRTALQTYFSHKKAWSSPIHPRLEESFSYLEEYMLRGGKFVRPFLTELGYRLAGGKISQEMGKVGAAVEIFKNYVLNIDDMADRDTLRHGGPTLEMTYRSVFSQTDPNTKAHYGRSFSEVVGGILATSSTELLLTAKIGTAKQRATALLRLEEHLLQITAAGWQIHFHQNLQPLSQASEHEFLRGLELVNSHYTFIGPLLVGTALTGNDRLDSVFKAYGTAAGLAFQLHDDVLGLFGDTDKTGKAVGNDVREGKKTILLQAAYRNAGKKDQAFLEKACGNSKLTQNQIIRVQQIVKNSGALDYSQKLARQYMQTSIKALKDYEKLAPGFLEKSETRYLIELAEYVINRDH